MEKTPLTESQLQALLRFKRHEQPPPGYFDDLLTSVRRRQREELLRRPAWRIFLERARAFFTSLDWNYAASMGAVLLIGVAAIRLAFPAPQPAGAVAVNTSSAPAPGANAAVAVNEPMLSLRPGAPALRIMSTKRPGTPAARTAEQGPTRFVIEAQPASYAPAEIRF